MKTMIRTGLLAAAIVALSACVYDPGYGYVRGSGYYGRGSSYYDYDYYPGYYPGYYGYSPSVGLGLYYSNHRYHRGNYSRGHNWSGNRHHDSRSHSSRSHTRSRRGDHHD